MTKLNALRIVTLNCGLGRDSIAMLCLLLDRELVVQGERRGPSDIDAVVFADTGEEWWHTYATIPVVRRLCAEAGVRFEVLEKGDERWHARPALLDDFRSRATVASLGKGDCTENHKILPIRRFVKALAAERFGLDGREWGAAVRRGERPPHLTIVGIAADETARLAESGRSPDYMSEAYPLVEMGIAKADEEPILARRELAHVKKSGCHVCPYQPPSWWWALSVAEPALFARAVEYEAHALARNPRMNVTGLKVAGRPLTIPEVVDRWRAANPDATTEAVLSKQYTRCTREARADRKRHLPVQMGLSLEAA